MMPILKLFLQTQMSLILLDGFDVKLDFDSNLRRFEFMPRKYMYVMYLPLEQSHRRILDQSSVKKWNA